MNKFFRTRKSKLKDQLTQELARPIPNLNKILDCIDEYEKNNLETIKKLKRKKVVYLRKIHGALKQTIDAHGPITINFIGSAGKRIYGNLLMEKKPNLIMRVLKKLSEIK